MIATAQYEMAVGAQNPDDCTHVGDEQQGSHLARDAHSPGQSRRNETLFHLARGVVDVDTGVAGVSLVLRESFGLWQLGAYAGVAELPFAAQFVSNNNNFMNIRPHTSFRCSS